MAKKIFHKFIYDKKNKVILENYDIAYRNDPDTWKDQKYINSLVYSYAAGLISKNKKNKKKLLDIGCGYGDFVNSINKLPNCKGYGFDISKVAILKGKKRLGKNLNTFQGDIRNGIKKFNYKFDFITLNGALWYFLKDYKFVFKEINKICHKNSNIIFTLTFPDGDPIGKEIIKNENDFYNLIKKHFYIIDNFTWVQKINLFTKQRMKKKIVNALILCKIKN